MKWHAKEAFSFEAFVLDYRCDIVRKLSYKYVQLVIYSNMDKQRKRNY